MLIRSEQASGKCDYECGGEATIGILCKGATGRVCEVMWICESCAEGEIHEPEAVRQDIKEHFGPTAYPDF